MKFKKIPAVALAVVTAAGLAACGGSSSGAEDAVGIRVWGAEDDQELLPELIAGFEAQYPDVDFNIQLGVESESTAKDTILTDVEAAHTLEDAGDIGGRAENVCVCHDAFADHRNLSGGKGTDSYRSVYPGAVLGAAGGGFSPDVSCGHGLRSAASGRHSGAAVRFSAGGGISAHIRLPAVSAVRRPVCPGQ